MKKICIYLLLFSLMMSGCQSRSDNQPDIEIKNAWIRAVGGMIEGQQPEDGMQGMHSEGLNTAAYMIIGNNGSDLDRLLRVEGDISKAIELHRSEMVDGVMRMNPVVSIEVPAGGQVELKPAGLHIMLIGLTQALKPGDKIQLTLVFEIAGPKTLDVEVRAP
jgi:copper(I)-binding protein